MLTVVKTTELYAGNTYENHGQLSQGVEQTVPSIIEQTVPPMTCDLCRVGVQCAKECVTDRLAQPLPFGGDAFQCVPVDGVKYPGLVYRFYIIEFDPQKDSSPDWNSQLINTGTWL